VRYLTVTGREITTEEARAYAEKRLGRPLTAGELALDLVGLDVDLREAKERLTEAIEEEKRRALNWAGKGHFPELKVTPKMRAIMAELVEVGRQHARDEIQRLTGERMYAYNPNQPRAPKGTRIGGRWVKNLIGTTLDEVVEEMGADWDRDVYARESAGELVTRAARATGGPPRLVDVQKAQLLGEVKPGQLGFREATENPEKWEPLGGFVYAKVGSARPPEYVFRAVSEEDWQAIQERGFIQSDQRMNLGDEGTVAALSDPTWYLPGGLASNPPGTYTGRLLRIRYSDEDGWIHDPADGYVKTQQPIPIERIDMVSPPIERDVTGEGNRQRRSPFRVGATLVDEAQLRAGLEGEARKYPTFEEFFKAFAGEIMHGRYYHWTDDSGFSIDPEKGPRDMSTLSSGGTDVGALMVTSDPEAWADYGGERLDYHPDLGPIMSGRKYVAVVDLTELPKDSYWQVNRGFGNEIYVDQPELARVERVIPRDEFPAEYEAYKAWLEGVAGTQEKLRRFWEEAQGDQLLPAGDDFTQLVVGARMRVREDTTRHPSFKGQEGRLSSIESDKVGIFFPEFGAAWSLPRSEVDLVAHRQYPRDPEAQTAMRLWRMDFSGSLALSALMEGREPAPAYRDQRMREYAQALDRALDEAPANDEVAYRIVPGVGPPEVGAPVNLTSAAAGFDRRAVEEYRRTFVYAADTPTLYIFPPEARGVRFADGQEAIIRGNFVVESVEWNEERQVWEAKLRLDDRFYADLDDRGLPPRIDTERDHGRLPAPTRSPAFNDAVVRLGPMLNGIRVRVNTEARGAIAESNFKNLNERLLDRLDKKIPGSRDAASRVISGLMIGGIGEVYEQNANLFPCFMYSAVMDGATCAVCQTYDGARYQSWDEGEMDLPMGGPNPRCLGDGRCRCRLVPCPPGFPDSETPEPDDIEGFRREAEAIQREREPGKPVDEKMQIWLDIQNFEEPTRRDIDLARGAFLDPKLRKHSDWVADDGSPSKYALAREAELRDIGRRINDEAERELPKNPNRDREIADARTERDAREAEFEEAMRARMDAEEAFVNARLKDKDWRKQIREELGGERLEEWQYRDWAKSEAFADPEVRRLQQEENGARIDFRRAEDAVTDTMFGGEEGGLLRDKQLEVLKRYRDMGGEGELLNVEPFSEYEYDLIGPGGELTLDADADRGVELVEESSRFYPDDWISRSNDREDDLHAVFNPNARGYYNSRERWREAGEDPGSMPTHIVIPRGQPTTNGDRDGVGPALHELAHRMEETVDELGLWSWIFHSRRTVLSDKPSNRVEKKLVDLFPGNYMNEETTYPDEFSHPYMGKIYEAGPYGASEIISMGLEWLWATPITPQAKKPGLDDDFRDFLLGLLATIGRSTQTRLDI
jgi:hypothetical protein